MRGFGRWSKLAIGAQVALAMLLAVLAAALVIELADGTYWRGDLTRSGRNTLDPAISDLIANLPEEVQVDVFFRPLRFPYDGVSLEAQGRTLELLFVAGQAHRDRLSVRNHDANDFEAVQARQNELGVEGVNLIVFTMGERRTVLDLFSEVAIVDWGNPTPKGLQYLTDQGIPSVVDARSYNPDPRAFEPARLSAFRGEEALAQALLKVSSGRAPRVYFSTGHGEPDVDGTLSNDLSRLARALERDGFEIETWDPLQEPAVPEDCEVLALVGPRQPFSDETRRAVTEYAENGGRLIASPSLAEVSNEIAGGVRAVLEEFGIHVEPGIVCQTISDRFGQEIEGHPNVALLSIDERGMASGLPLTEPLRQRGRRVQFRLSPALRRQQGGTRPGRLLLDVINSPRDSWRDLPNAEGDVDYRFDGTTETRGRQGLVMLAELPGPVTVTAGDVPKGYVLGIASSYFLDNGSFDTNRDFLLNAFNWMAEREYRVRVSPLTKGLSYLDVQRGTALSRLSYVLWFGLPGLSILIGGFVAWRRRT